MKIINFVQRCKTKKGFDTYNTIHAADNNKTFCGKKIDEMWFVNSSAGFDENSITCSKCCNIIRQYNQSLDSDGKLRRRSA